MAPLGRSRCGGRRLPLRRPCSGWRHETVGGRYGGEHGHRLGTGRPSGPPIGSAPGRSPGRHGIVRPRRVGLAPFHDGATRTARHRAPRFPGRHAESAGGSPPRSVRPRDARHVRRPRGRRQADGGSESSPGRSGRATDPVGAGSPRYRLPARSGGDRILRRRLRALRGDPSEGSRQSAACAGSARHAHRTRRAGERCVRGDGARSSPTPCGGLAAVRFSVRTGESENVSHARRQGQVVFAG